MSDSVEKKTENSPTELTEAQDESIIDLVEEIEEPSNFDPLSALEQQLLGIAEEIHPVGQPSNALDDLDTLEFDQEDTLTVQESFSAMPRSGAGDGPPSKESMAWVFPPPVDASTGNRDDHEVPSGGAKMETLELDEPSSETDEIAEAATPSSTEMEPLMEEDELELIEIEDTGDEDKLVWVDDLDIEKRSSPMEPMEETPAPASPLFALEPEVGPATSAVDVFAANMAAGWTETDRASDAPALTEALIPNAVHPSAPIPVLPIQSPPPESQTIAESLPALSNEQIDAAVERVIERKLGSTLEAIILRAIETAVSNEIQRLKTLLLEDDPGEHNP